MAEYYGIHDYRSFGALHIAALTSGLSLNSRTKRRALAMPITVQEYLLAFIADKMANLVWMQSEDGYNKQNAPSMILPKLLGLPEEEQEKENKSSGYNSVEDFNNAMNDINASYGV